jgi:hypothetical protein
MIKSCREYWTKGDRQLQPLVLLPTSHALADFHPFICMYSSINRCHLKRTLWKLEKKKPPRPLSPTNKLHEPISKLNQWNLRMFYLYTCSRLILQTVDHSSQTDEPSVHSVVYDTKSIWIGSLLAQTLTFLGVKTLKN